MTQRCVILHVNGGPAHVLVQCLKLNTLQTVEMIDPTPAPTPPTIMKKDMWQLKIFASDLFGSTTYHQCVIRSEEKLIGCDFPSLTDLHDSRAKKSTFRIVSDPSHPAHPLFSFRGEMRNYDTNKFQT